MSVLLGALVMTSSAIAGQVAMVPARPRSEALQENRWYSAVAPLWARSDALAFRAESAMTLAPSDEMINLHLQRYQGSPRLQANRRAEAVELRMRLFRAAEQSALRALEIVPNHPLATFVLVRTRDLAGAEPAETVPMFERLLTLLDPEDLERRSTVLFSLGVAYTKQLRFEQARDSYLALLRDPFAPGREVTLCNLAETYMYLHDVTTSLDRYVECANALPQRATGWWGLAIAHDRAAQDSDGRRAADRAIAIDPDLRDIHGDGVFYVPPYELYYYEGVAYEAAARVPTATNVEKRMAFNQAAASWSRYLQLAPSTDPWIARARAHHVSVVQQLAPLLRVPLETPPPSSTSLLRSP